MSRQICNPLRNLTQPRKTKKESLFFSSEYIDSDRWNDGTDEKKMGHCGMVLDAKIKMLKCCSEKINFQHKAAPAEIGRTMNVYIYKK